MLKYFGKAFQEFSNEDYLNDIQKELKNYKELCNLQFDWEQIEESKKYNKRRVATKMREQKRLKLKQLDDGKYNIKVE